MSVSRLDAYWRKLILTKFFTKGWGKPENLKRLFLWRKLMSNRETCQQMVPSDYPIHIDKEYKDGDCRVLEGHFLSPFVHELPGIMPKEVEIARFQMLLPLRWRDPKVRPVCIHLGATGDHYYWRRRIFTARPLLKETGIASILLENPFYGSRKPKEQLRSGLLNVSDLFVMGGATVLECLALLHWCEREGWGPLGISGVSMGGHMASLAATNWDKPISLIPLLSWSTSSQVWTQGILSDSIPWKTLQAQFFADTTYEQEIKKLIVSPEKIKLNPYTMGQHFVKDYSSTIREEQVDPRFVLPETHPCSMSETIDNSSSSVPSRSDIDSDRVVFAHSDHEQMSSHTTQPHIESRTPVDNKTETKTSSTSKSNLSNPSRLPLTVNYAQAKSNQQVKTFINPKPNLTLQHAASKSHLTSKPGKPITNLDSVREEALEFMRGAMDECTHLGNFSMPVDPELIVIVAAKQDAYIPRKGVLRLEKLWPGSELRYVDHGHVGAVLWHQNVFRQAIVDSFNKQIHKHLPGKDLISTSSIKKSRVTLRKRRKEKK